MFPDLVEQVIEDLKGILLIGVLSGLVGVSLGLVLPRMYRAEAAVTVRNVSGDIGGTLGGLGRTLGLQGLTNASGGIDFHRFLMTSPVVLDELVFDTTRSWTTSDGDYRGNLVGILRLKGDSGKLRDDARGVLTERINVEIDFSSNVALVHFEHRDPVFAASFLNVLLKEASQADLSFQQSLASDEVRFARSSLNAAKDSLDAADSDIRAFLEANRSYQGSPELVYRYQSLQRQHDLRVQIYLALVQRLEDARLRQVRDIPTVSVIYQATIPSEPDGLSIPIRSGIAFFAGCLLGVALSTYRVAEDRWPERHAWFVQQMRNVASQLSRRT